MKALHSIQSRQNQAADFNVCEMASRLGAKVKLLEMSEFGIRPRDGAGDWQPMTREHSLALHAVTLEGFHDNQDSRDLIRDRILAAGRIFVYGIAPGIHDELITWLTGGMVAAVDAIHNTDHCELPHSGREFTCQLAGARFPRTPTPTAALRVADPDTVVTLIAVSDSPTFACLSLDGCQLFLSTVSEFPNPNQPVRREIDIEPFYEALVPLIVFIRAACQEYAWHGGPSGACLIIDDPVLRPTYGWLDFRKLFESIQRHRYAVSVAYIPWNQWRTPNKAATFFRSAGERFSVCIHGCDHTNDEYGSGNQDHLAYRSRVAMDRMRRHRSRTGMDFEPIMVFPQGRFSRASLRGLSDSRFLAAINSTRFPIDGESRPLWELLRPVMSNDFPVFLRHYVEREFPLLFGLFLGRPAFLVEHHGFFKDGLPVMERLADQLNRLEPSVSWGSLRTTVERACWKRAVSNTEWEVEFFADRFAITNDSDHPVNYRLLKAEATPDSIAGVSVNDSESVAALAVPGHIVVSVTLNPGETSSVCVHRHLSPSDAIETEGALHTSKVLLRRALSEFRDEFLMKHPALLALSERVVRAVRANADSLQT